MKRTTPARSDAKKLFPLMFEMGRLLKHQISVDGYGPSFYLHLEILRYLREAGAADMRSLADYLRVAPPSATGVVNALVAQKLVSRKPDPQDRRRVMLSVTAAGVRLIDQAAKSREAAFARVIAPLSAHDRRELGRILTIITKR